MRYSFLLALFLFSCTGYDSSLTGSGEALRRTPPPVTAASCGPDAGPAPAGRGAAGRGAAGRDAGLSGTAGQAGRGGQAGQAGVPVQGQAGAQAHDHGGISIDPALVPGPAKGSTTFDVSGTSEQPVKSDEPGAFRTRCDYSHTSWDDPIVFAGQPGAAHLHTFVGNGATDAFSTEASLRSTGDSTCRGGTANKSAYWQPSLVVKGVPVKPTYIDVYWKTGYVLAPSSIRPMPVGLKAVAGNGSAKTTADTNARRAYWGCTETYIGENPVITACPAGEGIQGVVVFPQCSDGQTDSADHKSHLVDPVGGKCPSDHSLPIPVITLKFSYPAGIDISQARLSSDTGGVAPGLTLHGDIFEVFAPGIVEAFVQNCLNKGLDCHSHLLGDGRQTD